MKAIDIIGKRIVEMNETEVKLVVFCNGRSALIPCDSCPYDSRECINFYRKFHTTPNGFYLKSWMQVSIDLSKLSVNNYRKMNGLPLKRKGGNRKNEK